MSNQKAPPWSYSSLTTFENCPKRYQITRVLKAVVEPQTEATIHGNQVHKALELYVGEGKPLPEKYDLYQPIAEKIRETKGKKLVEYKFGLTSGLQPTTFFAKDCWVRGVLDVAITSPKGAVILDWKTGKRKTDHDQLSLFALAGLSLWPWVDKVKTGYIWLQSQQLDTKEFGQSDKTELAQEFAARAHKLEAAYKEDDWPARPSGLCGWCPVGKSLCSHWKGTHGNYTK
jgi:ATP-dependent exoDNAse (exonuclease V) beta subunit